MLQKYCSTQTAIVHRTYRFIDTRQLGEKAGILLILGHVQVYKQSEVCSYSIPVWPGRVLISLTINSPVVYRSRLPIALNATLSDEPQHFDRKCLANP